MKRKNLTIKTIKEICRQLGSYAHVSGIKMAAHDNALNDFIRNEIGAINIGDFKKECIAAVEFWWRGYYSCIGLEIKFRK